LQLSGAGTISNATVNVVAGTLDLNGTTQTITTLNVSAGSSLAGSTSTVNIGSGGVLNLGGNVVYAGGVGNAAGVGTISAGTLNLNGTRTFTVNDSIAVTTDMTVSSVIANGSATSGLTKAGAGTLALSGANTYSGGTTISGGTLIANADGTLGTGNVSLTAAGVTLTLQNGAVNNYISDNASISIVTGAIANLNFTGASDLVNGITLGGVVQTIAGTYGAVGSGATFQSAFFAGTGTLDLVPEPSTPVMVGVGALLLAGLQRLRRRRR
jgi:autotransporter-associated beta strand protein